jgi:hypothetical protein
MEDALVIRAGAAACVALTLVFACSALASPRTSERTLTIRLISTPKRTVVNDVPPKTMQQGLVSKGDTITGTSVLRNQIAQLGKTRGAIIGSDSFTITAISVSRTRVKVTVRLPAGTIRVIGEQTNVGGPAPLPVVGGTGTYALARGTCESQQLSGNRTLNIYRLRLP